MTKLSHEELQEENKQLRQEIVLLRQKVEALVKRVFGGGQSEKLDPKQLEMLMAGMENAPPAASTPPVREKKARAASGHAPVRQKLPPHLQTEKVVLEPMEVSASPGVWVKIGEEVTEELDWIPAQFLRRLFIRSKYVNRVEGRVVMADLPNRIIDKGMPGPGLLAQVIVSKFEDHLPLYRQEKIYRTRHGVALSRQTMVGWVDKAATWLQSIYRHMRKNLMEGWYLQVDETMVRYLDPDFPGKSRQGYLWAYSRPRGDVIFDWNTSRGSDPPRQMLEHFCGHLQCDGYAVYPSLARERPELILLACWAHARRNFVEALEESPVRAGWIVRQLAHLYAVEEGLRQSRAGVDFRLVTRQVRSLPLLRRIEKALRIFQNQRGLLPQSRLGQAVEYALGLWKQLTRFVEHGYLEIDNNLIENAIRPTAVGKKNWLFIGHPDAGWRSAVIYSILGSCHRAGIDPHEYLRDVFTRLPDMKASQIEDLVPSRWAELRRDSDQPLAA